MKPHALQTKAVLAGGVILLVVIAVKWLGFGHLARSSTRDLSAGMTVVLRTAPHLHDPSKIPALVQRLRAHDVREVLVQFKQDDPDEFPGGTVFYQSKIAPVAEGYEDGRLSRLVSALDRAGIRVCAWLPCLNDEVAARAHPEWRARVVHEDGSVHEQENWLCPREPGVIGYQVEILHEVLEQFPAIAAVYTDFIRFDDDYSCACARCLGALSEKCDEEGLPSDIQPMDIRTAAGERSDLWRTWTEMRAQAICEVVDALRDRMEETRPGLWFGACVLPFSAEDYSLNTQSGQDLYEMARVGLDELVLMGYWDDWEKSPDWLRTCILSASELTRDECQLAVLLDGDMAVRRTWITLEAVRDVRPTHVGYFNYGEWTDGVLARVDTIDRVAREHSPPRPAFTAVCIRIDTEPDYQGRYDTVRPEMIQQLSSMLDAEGVKATFITCGRLLEFPGHREALEAAAAAGHEIGSHAYDHEQLDGLTPDEERLAIERGLKSLNDAGFSVSGFGAPRNSITPAGRDVLMEHGLKYDGSSAYDPLRTFLDAEYAHHGAGDGRRILMAPFMIPNDWDALYVLKVDPQHMLEMWEERLAAVVQSGEPICVVDVHQWLASRPDVVEVLQAFIRRAQARPECRFMTLRDAAQHTTEFIEAVEAAARKHAP